jgi:hypothetical protein
MASSIFDENQPAYARLLLMIFGETTVGLFLYALFAFIPVAAQMVIVVGSWAIVATENLTFPKNKSLGSLLSAITGTAGFSCGVAWKITHLVKADACRHMPLSWAHIFGSTTGMAGSRLVMD